MCLLFVSLVQGSVRTAWPLLSPTAPFPVHQCMLEHMELVTPNSIGNKVCLCNDKYCIVPAILYAHMIILYILLVGILIDHCILIAVAWICVSG